MRALGQGRAAGQGEGKRVGDGTVSSRQCCHHGMDKNRGQGEVEVGVEGRVLE